VIIDIAFIRNLYPACQYLSNIPQNKTPTNICPYIERIPKKFLKVSKRILKEMLLGVSKLSEDPL
jgi:hypothetical protein